MNEFIELESGKEKLDSKDLEAIERMYGNNISLFRRLFNLVLRKRRNEAVVLFEIEINRFMEAKKIVEIMNQNIKKIKVGKQSIYTRGRINYNISKLEKEAENLNKRTSMYQKYIGNKENLRVLLGLKSMIILAEGSLEKAKEHL